MSLKLTVKNAASVVPLTNDALLHLEVSISSFKSNGSTSPSSKTVVESSSIRDTTTADNGFNNCSSVINPSKSTSNKILPAPNVRVPEPTTHTTLPLNKNEVTNSSNSQRDTSWRESCGVCYMDSTTSSERSKHSKKSSTKSMPANEETRLEILRKSKLISDESIREDVNNILELATRIFKVPTSFINLIDTDWLYFKSIVGANFTVTPRDGALCAYIICQEPGVVVYSIDTLLDPRFQENPNVTCGPKIRFYAGFPITLHGCNLGTFCIADVKPRASFTENDCKTLKDMGLIITDILAEKEKRNQYASTVDSSKFVVSMCQGLKPALAQVSFHKEKVQHAFEELKSSRLKETKQYDEKLSLTKVEESNIAVEKELEQVGFRKDVQENESSGSAESKETFLNDLIMPSLPTTGKILPMITRSTKPKAEMIKVLNNFKSALNDLNKEIETMLKLGHFSLQNIFPSSSSSILATSKEAERRQFGLDQWLEELKKTIVLPSYFVPGFHEIVWKLNYHSGTNSLITEVNTEILASITGLLVSRNLLRWQKVKIAVDMLFKHIALGVEEGVHRSSCQLIVRVVGSHPIQSEKVDAEIKQCEATIGEEGEEEKEKESDYEKASSATEVVKNGWEKKDIQGEETTMTTIGVNITVADSNFETTTVPNSPRQSYPKKVDMCERAMKGGETGSLDTASTSSLESLSSMVLSHSYKHNHNHHHQLKHFYRDTNFASLDFATLQRSDLFVAQFILQGLRGTLTYNKKEFDKDDVDPNNNNKPKKMSKLQERELKRQMKNNKEKVDKTENEVQKVLLGEEYVLSVPCKIVWNHGADEMSSLENEVLLYSLADYINSKKEESHRPADATEATVTMPTTITSNVKNLNIQGSALVPQQTSTLSNSSLVGKLNLEHLTIDTTVVLPSTGLNGTVSPPFCKSPVSSANINEKTSVSPRYSNSPRGTMVGILSPRSSVPAVATALASNMAPPLVSVSIAAVSQIMNQASRRLSDAIKRPFKGTSTASVSPVRQEFADSNIDNPFPTVISPHIQ